MIWKTKYFFKVSYLYKRLDTGDDNRISKEEFTNPEVKSIVELWVGPIADMAAEFDIIDKNGGGQILFDEFVDWATAKNLDIEDDDDWFGYIDFLIDVTSICFINCYNLLYDSK